MENELTKLQSATDSLNESFTGYVTKNMESNHLYINAKPIEYYKSTSSPGKDINDYIMGGYWNNYYCDQYSTGEYFGGEAFPYIAGDISISSKKKMDEYIKIISGLFGVTEYYIPDRLESINIGILNKMEEIRKTINELLMTFKEANSKKDKEAIKQSLQYHSGRLSVYSDFFNIISKVIEENK